MTKIAYGNAQTMALEWLNNLFVLTYLKQINYETMEFNLAQDMQKVLYGCKEVWILWITLI